MGCEYCGVRKQKIITPMYIVVKKNLSLQPNVMQYIMYLYIYGTSGYLSDKYLSISC